MEVHFGCYWLRICKRRVKELVFGLLFVFFLPPGAQVCINICTGASVRTRSTLQISHLIESLFLIYTQMTYLEVKPSIVFRLLFHFFFVPFYICVEGLSYRPVYTTPTFLEKGYRLIPWFRFRMEFLVLFIFSGLNAGAAMIFYNIRGWLVQVVHSEGTDDSFLFAIPDW